MTEVAELHTRIDELETKQAFQEYTIEELNEALTSQQLQIEKMQLQLKFLVGKVKGFEPSNMASEQEETPPPHY